MLQQLEPMYSIMKLFNNLTVPIKIMVVILATNENIDKINIEKVLYRSVRI